MEASKLIETLRFCGDPESCCIGCSRLDEMGVDGGTHACMCDLMQKAANAIEELESQLKSQKCNRDPDKRNSLQATSDGWIPVTERLPEDDEVVLIACKIGKMFVGYHKHLYPGCEVWRILTARDSTKTITYTVTHWMPLPQPPKGE